MDLRAKESSIYQHDFLKKFAIKKAPESGSFIFK